MTCIFAVNLQIGVSPTGTECAPNQPQYSRYPDKKRRSNRFVPNWRAMTLTTTTSRPSQRLSNDSVKFDENNFPVDASENLWRAPPFSNRNQKVFPSSSFQTHSIPLLYMISVADSSIPVVFINTGFLFSETLSFCDEIIRSDQDGF